MDGTVTKFIIEYFDTINLIFDEDKNKYQGLASDIQMCFVKHGWKCKSNTSSGGFYTASNHQTLLSDFNTIVNKYFFKKLINICQFLEIT